MADVDHRLLLTHFARWVEAKKLVVDLDLVGDLLELRATYDDLEPTWWPTGSVEDLLLRLWPSKGDVTPPEPDVLVPALEAWLKFLRSTGRMSGRSADVKVLVKETRSAAPRMAAAAADRSGWSPTKALLEWGRQQGLSLEGSQTREELDTRLQEINAAWNALPAHERVRRMPSPELNAMSGAERRAAAGGGDPIVGLILDFRYELPDGELPPPAATAPGFREAPFLRSLLGYLNWAQHGQPLTDTNNLRLAAAREVWDRLDLQSWEREHRRIALDHPGYAGVAKVGLDAYVDAELAKPWRSASDVVALERLWWAGVEAGRLEVRGRKVYADPRDPATDEEWLGFGCRAVYGVFEYLGVGSRLAAIGYALLRSYTRDCSLVPWAEIADFYHDWLFGPEDPEAALRGMWECSVRAAVHLVADTGIVEVSDEGVRLTPPGDVFVTWWLQVMERPRDGR